MSLIAGFNMIPDTHDLTRLLSYFMKHFGTLLYQMAVARANIPNGERFPNHRAWLSRDLKRSLARTPFSSGAANAIAAIPTLTSQHP